MLPSFLGCLVSPQPTQPSYLPLNSTYTPCAVQSESREGLERRQTLLPPADELTAAAQTLQVTAPSIWSQLNFLKGDGRDLRTVQNERS